MAKLGQSGEFSQPISKLQAKEAKQVAIQITGLDPLEVIRQGVSGSIATTINGRALHEANVSYKVASQTDALAQYFFDLLTNEQQSNPGSESRDSRLANIAGIIISETQDNISSEVNWNETSSVSRTLLGKISDVYAANKVGGKINADTQTRIDALAIELDSMASKVGVFKRKAYRAILNKLSTKVKVKKK